MPTMRTPVGPDTVKPDRQSVVVPGIRQIAVPSEAVGEKRLAVRLLQSPQPSQRDHLRALIPRIEVGAHRRRPTGTLVDEDRRRIAPKAWPERSAEIVSPTRKNRCIESSQASRGEPKILNNQRRRRRRQACRPQFAKGATMTVRAVASTATAGSISTPFAGHGPCAAKAEVSRTHRKSQAEIVFHSSARSRFTSPRASGTSRHSREKRSRAAIARAGCSPGARPRPAP